MIVSHNSYAILSANNDLSNRFWEQDLFPSWATLSGFWCASDLPAGIGVEPHYHDCDEFWLFLIGNGEAWLNQEVYDITPQTVVYTPMGCVHRFQLFTDGACMAPLVTRLARQKRPGHLIVTEVGPPEPTFPGFVIPGAQNSGLFSRRTATCPLSELRGVTFTDGEKGTDGAAPATEYWLVIDGAIQLTLNDVTFELIKSDLAVLQAGVHRHISTTSGAQVILARE